ncbi:carbonic anhydrase [Favolaschia claudopus]|uniref:Carbonic anhydrase n=1 Tax=Favolaschia claudopus TaxID=2862362 RepID=A0AAW0EKM5_9AGAR
MTSSFVQANEKYAANFSKPDGSGFKNYMIIACCDPRIDPESQLGIKSGEAVIIRNAGGSAIDALRSIIVPQHAIGVTGEIAVFHHTDCGMTKVTTPAMREMLKKANPDRQDVAATVDGMEFYEICDVEQSVRADVDFLAENALILRGTRICGWVYDVETGRIEKIVERVA